MNVFALEIVFLINNKRNIFPSITYNVFFFFGKIVVDRRDEDFYSLFYFVCINWTWFLCISRLIANVDKDMRKYENKIFYLKTKKLTEKWGFKGLWRVGQVRNITIHKPTISSPLQNFFQKSRVKDSGIRREVLTFCIKDFVSLSDLNWVGSLLKVVGPWKATSRLP